MDALNRTFRAPAQRRESNSLESMRRHDESSRNVLERHAQHSHHARHVEAPCVAQIEIPRRTPTTIAKGKRID
ncbi:MULTISPECIES: hypothetical protein [Burkholderia]|uniref:hypothetical protein n=1 Tax=Burkholderia TaxID=32008 RepID=UPI000F54B788|nr:MULTISPECIES: hypothetical protein [Burkholderia]RQM59625.1 hypothetical protein EHZ18_08790 [Burkholderia vietnamiensis]